MDKKFKQSLLECTPHDAIDPVLTDGLYRYFFFGISPGSFLTNILCNDFVKAMSSSHPSNSVLSLIGIAKWLKFDAPAVAWGNSKKIVEWQALTDDERHSILLEAGIAQSLFDKIKHPA